MKQLFISLCLLAALTGRGQDFIVGHIFSSTQDLPKNDTVPAIMLISDTARPYSLSHWIGFPTGKETVDTNWYAYRSDVFYLRGFVIGRWKPGSLERAYLADPIGYLYEDKKPLRKGLVVWQIFPRE